VSGERHPNLIVPVPLDVLRAWCGERRADAAGRAWLDVLRSRLATRQEGVVGLDQLRVLGWSEDQVAWRLKRRVLIPVWRGVYAVGHEALSFRGRAIAAQLAIGDDAALSREAAAHLRLLLPTPPPVIDVTTPGRRARSRPGLITHAGDVETERHQGLLITTPEQTLHDLRRHPRIASMTSEALYLGLIPPASAPDDAPTRSKLERRMLKLIARAGLPRPQCQHPIGPYTADFHWPASRVIAETDGWEGHRFRFQRDRARDAFLLARGHVVIRFTWAQLRDEPVKVAAQLAALLAHRGELAP
jgi:very-short-patch-repair endonuclease